ncbi:signal peptidase II [Gleimia europaea ACS-120-V-Col10b]|uniref:Lipoprotein signal peptidase n=2 Tax=Gleimia TaxID=2692113 RepID=A0A9W5RDB1_9ACTO|nr:signal peptidase II [Gleimia europaea ACS-120-V-Col10b]
MYRPRFVLLSRGYHMQQGKQGFKTRIIFYVVAIFAVISDQLSKVWALNNLSTNQIDPFIGSFISFQLVHNPGAAFSLLDNATWVFTVLALVIVIVILFSVRKVSSKLWLVFLALLFGGAIGNLIDRLIQPPSFGMGHVVDFLNWNGWFVGNVADIYIVVAAAVMFLLAVLEVPFTRDLNGEQQ